MAIVRTFLDANVLIRAFRGVGEVSERACAVLDDADREFVCSDILSLELLPKAQYHGQHAEEAFYDDFFQAAAQLVATTPDLVEAATDFARRYRLSAADALHVAAAIRAGAEELVTAEKLTKPLFRVTELRVVSIAA